MTNKVRAFYSVNSASLDGRTADLTALCEDIRAEEGCLEFDFLRSVEFPENFVQMELWENAAAFDRHWKRRGAEGVFCDPRALSSPGHRGAALFPRRQGLNGAEFYPFREFEGRDRLYVPKDPNDRTEHLSWPSRSAVRILWQGSTDPAHDHTLLPYSADTRTHPGCLEFDWFRSVTYPENMLHLELWEGPAAVYDRHYFRRALQELWGNFGVDRPSGNPVERRYGQPAFEFYQHCFFELLGDVWEPEDPSLRLTTVRWA